MGGVCCTVNNNTGIVPKGKATANKKLKKPKATPDSNEAKEVSVASDKPLQIEVQAVDESPLIAEEKLVDEGSDKGEETPDTAAEYPDIEAKRPRQQTVKCTQEDKLNIQAELEINQPFLRSNTIPANFVQGPAQNQLSSLESTPVAVDSTNHESPKGKEKIEQKEEFKVKDNLEEVKQPVSFSYEFEGNPDEIIQELETRRSKWDDGVIFTKNELIKHIDDSFANADTSNKQIWEEKLNKKNDLVVHLSKGTEKVPGKFVIKGVTYFNKGFKLGRVVKSMYDEKQRCQWDKKQLETLESIDTKHKSVRLLFFRFKKFLIFDPKEFSDKMIQFEHNGCVYSYSSTNNSRDKETSHLKSKNKKTDECETIIALSRFSQDETGRVIAETLIQSDNKVSFIPGPIMSWQLPKALEAYIKQWKAYILKEHNGKLAK